MKTDHQQSKSLASGQASIMARALIPREMLSWALISVTLGAVEGGLLGVLVKTSYSGTASPLLINLAVAVVSGAPAFANLVSFWFASWARGRDKVRLLSQLMFASACCVLLIAAAPRSLPGLLLLMSASVAARMLWAATITLRATVWRANFPRHVRARITGQMTTLSSLLIAASSAVLGALLDQHAQLARLLWLLTALSGFAAAMVYRRGRIRRHQHILKLERKVVDSDGSSHLWQRFLAVLRDDFAFRRYMQAMFVFGTGNLMVTAPLIILLNEQFGLERLQQVLITTSIPLLLLAVSVPFWARLLDGQHIIPYRARQSWGFVLAIGFFAAACMFHVSWMLWAGGGMLGIAYGGGVLGWNLGHNDFSSDHSSELYMGVHVTLTGLRGLIMPAVGVLIYELLEAWQSGWGRYSLLVPLALSTAGACWFVLMARQQARLSV